MLTRKTYQPVPLLSVSIVVAGHGKNGKMYEKGDEETMFAGAHTLAFVAVLIVAHVPTAIPTAGADFQWRLK
jgi:hypothetical protein